MITIDFDPQSTRMIEQMSHTMLNQTGMYMRMHQRLQNYFEGEGLDILIQGVQSILGTSQMGLNLDPEYAARKMDNPFVVRIPGKALLQPGILSATLYHSITGRASRTGVDVFIGNLRGSTRAGTFQRSADPAAYAEKVRAKAGQIRKPQSENAMAAAYRVRLADVTAYAAILDSRTQFLKKGIKAAEPQFVQRLEEALLDELSFILTGR